MTVEAFLLARDQGATDREAVEQVVRDEREVMGRVLKAVLDASDEHVCSLCGRLMAAGEHDRDCPVRIYKEGEE